MREECTAGSASLLEIHHSLNKRNSGLSARFRPLLFSCIEAESDDVGKRRSALASVQLRHFRITMTTAQA